MKRLREQKEKSKSHVVVPDALAAYGGLRVLHSQHSSSKTVVHSQLASRSSSNAYIPFLTVYRRTFYEHV